MSQIVKKHPNQFQEIDLGWLETSEPHSGNVEFLDNSTTNLQNVAKFIATSTYDLDKISTTEQAIFFKEKYGINDPDYLKVLERVCPGNPTFQDCGMLLGYCQAFPNDASCMVQGPIWNWKPWMILVVVVASVLIGISLGSSKTKKEMIL